MPAKAKLQTIGTVVSLIMAYISLKLTKNLLTINTQNLTQFLVDYSGFAVIFLTIVIMGITGASYFNSRLEHVGLIRVLYILVAIAHTILAPCALIVATMKIQFGQYWWVVIVGVLVFIYWVSQQEESQN